MGTNFNELWNDTDLIEPSQKARIDFEVALIGKLIEAREAKGLSQRELAKLSGLKQPAIARLESMRVTPKIDTLFRILEPLGYTLAVVPKKKVKSITGKFAFAEEILNDLIQQGFSGKELLTEFEKVNRQVRPAMENLISEADKAAEVEMENYEDRTNRIFGDVEVEV